MKQVILSTTVAFLFVGCTAGPSISQVPSPDGSVIQIVKCVKNTNECFSAASKSCNGGSYQVYSSESHAGGIWADALAGPATWYSFNYKCGPSNGKMPEFPFGGQIYVPPTVINNSTTVNNRVNIR